jgi:triacylglycerol lipase
MYPVLLVHGIYDSGRRFTKLQAALSTRGFNPIYAMDILPPDASISMEAMGAQVQAAVHELRQSTGASKVNIVAFSMGALAVRYFLQRLNGRALVRRFISLAGPHHGTLTAYLGWKVGSRQMRPGSSFLQDLNAEADPWGDVEVFSFRSTYDMTIIPSKSSLLPHAHNHAYNVLFHHWMVSDRKVIEAIAQALANDHCERNNKHR